MLEFARVPRSVWREVKTRFVMSLEAVKDKRFTRPFCLTFPDTDCTFMIAPLPPEVPASTNEEDKRLGGLQNLTYAAMYQGKTSKGVGILVSKEGEFVQIDWSLLITPWSQDPEMDTELAKHNPFREVKGKVIDSFRFLAATSD
jgi:hypothetical protein